MHATPPRVSSLKWLMAMLVVAWFSIAVAAQAELQLQSVRADRVYYEPGAEAKFTVVVTNPDDQPGAATLQVELVRDLDTSKSLGDQALTVPGKGEQTWEGSAKLPVVLGMEVRATLRRGEQVLAQKSDVFSCARSVHQVLMFGHGNHGAWQFSGQMDAIRDRYPMEFAQQIRDTYGNCVEKFAWAPSDFDDLTPEGDRWWAGQTTYNECKANIIAVIEAMHRQGVKVVTYGKAAAGGIAGFEHYRRRPDLAAYTNGRFWSENYSAAFLDWITALGPPHPNDNRPIPGTPDEMEKAGYAGSAAFQVFLPQGGQNWCSVWYDCGDPEVAAVGIGELADSARMFGWDGVRFDGEFWAGRHQRLDGSWSAPEKWDAEAANVALVKRMKQECLAAKPGYLFGYNAGTDITWSVPLDNTPATFREKCHGDGLIGNEAYAFPGDVPWMTYCQRVRREAEIVRYYGGHYATYAFDRSANNLYNCILQYGLRAHLMNSYVGPQWEWVARSATRFSRVLWDDSLTTWRGAEKTLQVSGSRPVWWQEFAAVGGAPEGGARYIIHLYNPPGSPTTLGKEQLPAAPASDVVVRWPGLTGLRQAWVVDMPATTAQPIKPVSGAFTIGEVPYWKILVVDVTTLKPAAEWEPAPGGKAAGPSAADLQIAPPANTGGESWRSVVEPERWGGGEDVAERLADPTASAGGAVMGTPGGKTGPTAYTYEYPRIPGRYRCTYRLKVADNTLDQPVFALTTSRSVNAPFPGIPGLYGENKMLKATDFKQAGAYETFATEFDYADYGFMACGVSYLGGVKGWWDSLTVDLLRPWTDQELADHYKSFQRPAGLTKTDNGALDVLVVRGLFNRLYRLDEAIQSVGGTRTDTYTSYHQQQGTTLQGYKWDWQPLWNQDVIVLADVETKGLNYGQVLMLSDWVKDGGGLLILGGPVTLGQDDNMKRAWPLMLPVELSGPWEIRQCEPPAKTDAGVVLYRHMVKPKAGAEVALKGSRGEPLLVRQTYGKGRVAVFAGTVLGEAPAGAKAFWETPEWVKELTDEVRWLGGR